MKDLNSFEEKLPDFVCTRRKAKNLGIRPPSLVDVHTQDKKTNKRHSLQTFRKRFEENPQSQDELFSAHSSMAGSKRSTLILNEEVLQQLEKETWIQCDSVSCQKWRRVQSEDVKDVGEAKWFCSMNKDPLHNTCDSQEEDYVAYDKLANTVGVKYVYSQMQEGTLVWAKLTGYCRWPALITRDPECDLSVFVDADGNPVSYHVEFLGEPHSHGWVSSNSVSVYGHRDSKEDNSVIASETSSLKNNTIRRKCGKKRKAPPKKPVLQTYKRETVTVAVGEADSMLHWNNEQRLNTCVFKAKDRLISQPDAVYDFDLEKHSKVQKNGHPKEDVSSDKNEPGRCAGKRGTNTTLTNGSTNILKNCEKQNPYEIETSQQTDQNFMNFSSTLMNKTKEEKLTFDIETYRRNEKAFEHDVRRFLDRHGMRIKQLPLWQNIPIPLFQLFSVVFDQGGFYQVCKSRGWSKVYRELTDHPTSIAGTRAKTYYYKNLLSYELYLRGKDYQYVLASVKQTGKGKQKTSKHHQQSLVDTESHCSSEESDDLEAMLATLEATSHLCNMDDEFNMADLPGEPNLVAPCAPAGLGVMFHEDSPTIQFSPGIKLADTASEFGYANLPGDSPPASEDYPEDDTDNEGEKLLQDLQNVKEQIDDLSQQLAMEE